MSGAEAIAVLGLISSIIAIVGGTKQVFDAATNTEDLPEAFREAASRLPIVTNILNNSKQHIQEADISDDSCKGVKHIVDACEKKAKKLDDLFRKVIPGDGASRRERYISAVKTLGKGNEVEKLIKGMLEDIQLLACEHGLKIATKAQQELIAKAITEVSAVPLSVPEDAPSFTANYSGSGTQYNAQGEYIAQGSARQFNSAGGTMNFGKE